MAGIDLTGITLNPIAVTDLKEFIIERTYEHPMLVQIHGKIRDNIKVKSQLILAGLMGKTGLKKAASCARQMSGATIELTEKYFNPKGIEDTLVVCQANLDPLFAAYFDKITSYRQLYDITGSDLEVFYAIMLVETMVKTIFRAAWFGDTTVAAAGVADNGLVDSANVKFYDYLDGLWKQIIAAQVAGSLTKVEITENTVTTSKDAQLALADGRGLELLRAVWKAADVRLRTDVTAQFLVSREIFDNYVEYLEDTNAVYDIDALQNGLESVTFKNRKVINMETVWGLDSRDDFVLNTADAVYDLPHRILFTIPENIPIGTLNSADFVNLEQWYNQDERQNKTAYGFTEDAKLIEEYMGVAAY